jgi:hypothetical protein
MTSPAKSCAYSSATRSPGHQRILASKSSRGRQAGGSPGARSSVSFPDHVRFRGLYRPPRKYVKLADTVRGFKEILEGKYDQLPSRPAICLPIEDVVEKPEMGAKV